MTSKTLAAAGVLAALVLPPAASAATAAPDTTFNRTGELRLDYGGIDSAGAVAVQPDGKVIVASDTSASTSARIQRLNADGSVDDSFGTGGTVVIESGPAEDHLTALLVQPDGKIVIGGSSGGRAVLYRLTAVGTPDRDFGVAGGVLLTTNQQTESVFALALQRDGKIVAVGSTSPTPADAVVWRRNAVDGSADANFNAGGRLSVNLGSDEVASAVAVQADGRIVIAGNKFDHRDAFVARLNAITGLDLTFHGGGTVTIDEGGQEFANAVAVQTDGKILVAGRTSLGNNGSVYRMLDNGAPDRSFNDSAVHFIDDGGDETIADLLLQPDGKIVLVGSTSVGGDGTLHRLNTDGTLDRSFDGDGVVTVDSGAGESLSAGALEPDGNIVAVGFSNSGNADAMVYRRLGDPHTLTVATTGSGTVASDPAGIACGRLCAQAFDVGTRVTLTAVPAPGSVFTGWSGGGCAPASAVCRVELHADTSATATFAASPPAPTTVPVATPAPVATPTATPTTTPPATDTTAPRISAASLTSKRFSAKRGTSVRFTLSEAATVTTTVRHTTVRRAAKRGKNVLPYNSRKLKPGRYTLTLAATDAAGNRSAPATLTFTVVRSRY